MWYIVPLLNNFLTRLFSKLRMKRKDFQEIARLVWAQEAPGSNPGAPTTYFLVFNSLCLTLFASGPELGSISVQIRASRLLSTQLMHLPSSV
jgi:hypothetical protein